MVKMITYSIIQKSQLEGAHRLDAEYYAISTRIKTNFLLGGDIVDFIQYGTSEELNEDGKGFPVLRLNEMHDFFIDKPMKSCSKINKYIFQELELHKDDVLICRTNGNPKLVGKTAIVLNEPEIAFASYLFRVRPKKDIINSASLVTFLNSKYGREEIEKHLKPSNQSNFSPATFRNIKIPIIKSDIQKIIENLVLSAYELRINSEKIYSQAEDLLLEELGLRDFVIEDDLSFVVNLSEVEKANRVDAEYFQPKYQKLIEKIKSYNARPFTDEVESIAAKFNPNQDESYKYVDLGNINSSTGMIDGFEEVLGKEAPSRARRVLKENDVIVSSVEGSLDKVALVGEDRDAYLASTGFFQFRSKNILPEVLLILTKSIVTQWQMKKNCAGTILTAVPSEALNTMLIPVLPMQKQKEIEELVRKSHTARKKSKELLEEAKRKVEEMIEKGAK